MAGVGCGKTRGGVSETFQLENLVRGLWPWLGLAADLAGMGRGYQADSYAVFGAAWIYKAAAVAVRLAVGVAAEDEAMNDLWWLDSSGWFLAGVLVGWFMGVGLLALWAVLRRIGREFPVKLEDVSGVKDCE